MPITEQLMDNISGRPIGIPLKDAIITHYGIKRRSGRYPWGSGENPYQSEQSPPRQSKRETIFVKKQPDPVKMQRKDMIKSSNLRKMSPKDLQDMIDRMKKEKELKNLIEADISPGKKIIKEVLVDVGKQTAKEVLQGSVRYGLNLALQEEGDRKFSTADLARAIYPNLNKKDQKKEGD